MIEAEVEARTALAGSLGVVGQSGQTMGLLSRFSSVLVEQWRLSEAEQLIRAVIDTSLASGIDASSRIVAAARSQLALVLGLQERFDDQMAEFSALRISLQNDPEGNDHFLYENPEYALAASREGRHDEALTIMRSAVRRHERALGPDHPLLTQTQGQLAIVLSNAGHRDEALALFRRVASALIRGVHLLGDARSRRAKTVAILEAYMSLLMSLPPQNGESAAEAFQIGDVARGQGVMEAVNASVARMHLGSPDLANLARFEQDARHHDTKSSGSRRSWPK